MSSILVVNEGFGVPLSEIIKLKHKIAKERKEKEGHEQSRTESSS